LKFKTKIEAYLGFGIAQPLTTALLGYFPEIGSDLEKVFQKIAHMTGEP
jgi:hypothetical protein